METMTLLPQSRPLTAADLETMPDDGHRYELIDGTLIVTPAPSRPHQVIVGNLFRVLDRACPGHLRALFAPVDVKMAEDTVVQPDLLVVDKAEFADLARRARPLLAVEILSPSTRLIDLGTKRARYEVDGCPAYWVVDPEGPSLVAWELRDGEYVEVARVSGEETFVASTPYAIEVTPARLLD